MLVDRAGVEVKNRGDHPDLAPRTGDRLADVLRLDLRKLLGMLFDERREAAQQAPTIGEAAARQAGKTAVARATAAVGLLDPACSSSASGMAVAGLKPSGPRRMIEHDSVNPKEKR